ncbi:hypothetical protein K2Q00_01860 [Patescibacteria group bacterium]|nr:hypothetical protein [Patescibacteria group bacterium]
MARVQAYCAGCSEAFGMTARRSHYNGLQFHHVDYQSKCLEDYKKKHPPLTIRQRVGGFVLALLPAFLQPSEEENSSTTEVMHAADD